MPWELNGNTGAGNFLGTTDNTALVVKTNGTAHVQVDPSGNVGIGTASPRSILEVSASATGALGPVVTLTNTGGQANAAAALDFNTFLPSAAGVYNPSSRIEAVDRGNFANDLVFLSNQPGAANSGLVEKMRIFGAPVGVQINQGLVVSGPATITGGIYTSTISISGLAFGPPNTEPLLLGSPSFGTLVIGGGPGVIASIGVNMSSPTADLHLRDKGMLRIGLDGVLRIDGSSVPGEGAASQFSFGGNGVFGIDAPGVPNGRFVVLDSGNVGVGVANPSSKLEVHGDASITGNVSVARDVLLTGADCAEQFDSAGDRLPEPGTVVVLDESGALRESCEAYDKKVAGVVSGAGDFRPALVLDNRPSQDRRISVALVGKVYCKVDAQYSAIEVGDLLTTSPTPGYAMKATEPLKAFGAVIGKALKSLESGTGLVPILVALQ